MPTPAVLAIAGIGIILLIVIMVYLYESSSSSTPTATPTTGAVVGSTTAPATAATTPTYTSTPNTIGSGNYGTCTGTAASGYCILPMAQAINLCNSDPNCQGYGQATGSTGWMASYGNDYQLEAGPWTTNTQWTTYVKN